METRHHERISGASNTFKLHLKNLKYAVELSGENKLMDKLRAIDDSFKDFRKVLNEI